jgi:prepilin-type N-terminal cleavage/methylation domain-containing protein
MHKEKPVAHPAPPDKEKDMFSTRRSSKRGFSLLELVIVVVIIGIIAAIAIPRMSRGSAGANDSALAGDLAVLRSAIDLFAAEHGGAFPSLANLPNSLTMYTDNTTAGSPATSKDSAHPYGPYVRVVPKLKVGTNKGAATFTTTTPAGTDTAGWLYNATTGDIRANLADADRDGANVAYNTY